MVHRRAGRRPGEGHSALWRFIAHEAESRIGRALLGGDVRERRGVDRARDGVSSDPSAGTRPDAMPPVHRSPENRCVYRLRRDGGACGPALGGVERDLAERETDLTIPSAAISRGR